MKLIVGLGNPGKEYENTRHNMGFMVMDELAKNLNMNYNKSKFNGLYFDANVKGEKIIFLKPQKYMNLSGEVVRDFINFYKIKTDDILVIVDDLDMPLGKIRLKKKSSSGGHNGLKNIFMYTNTIDIKRIKIGIGNDKLKDTKDYVLSKFSKEDIKLFNDSIKLAAKIALEFIDTDFNVLMSNYN